MAQKFQDLEGGVLDAQLFGIEHKVRLLRLLEAAVLSSELFDLSGCRFGVEPLRVAGLTGGVVGLDVDLGKVVTEDAPRQIAKVTARGDQGAKNDYAVVCQHLGKLGGTANVLEPVLVAESEVAVEAGAEVVAIKPDHEAPLVVEDVFECVSDGGLAGPGQPAEPKDASFLLEKDFLGVARQQGAGMDVSGGHGFGLWFAD